VYDKQWDDAIAPYWSDLAAFARAENPDLLVCLELHPGTSVFNVETFERLAALGPSIAANLDPSHFFWMGMDGHAVARRIGEWVGHVHGKDTMFHSEYLALNGVLDRRWPAPAKLMPWTFAVPGRGHDAAWWAALFEALRDSPATVVSIEHEDPFVSAEEGVPEAATLLLDASGTVGAASYANEKSDVALVGRPRVLLGLSPEGMFVDMTTSRAAVMEGPGRLVVREFDVPAAEPGCVVMRVSLSGICGTDKHTFRGESKQYAGTTHERVIEYPLICGHENVGIVADVGGEVRASDGQLLKVGDRIVPGANVPCGRCYFCMNGYPYYFCEHLENYGNSLNCGRKPSLFGGWSEYLYLLPRTPIFRVPDKVPDNVAVITEVMAVTHGVETANTLLALQGTPPVGKTVVVLGVGPLGLCHVVKARLTGAGRIIAIDRFAGRLDLAKEFGADEVLNVSESDLGQRQLAVADATNGLGADVVFDCSGVPETFVESLRLVRMGGVVVEVGTFIDMGPISVNPNSDICTRNVSVIGVGGETAQSYSPALQLMAANLDRFPLDRIVTHHFGLDKATDAVLTAQSDRAMQVVIDPSLREGAT
jgi:L-iditol 2-dehydrogenase